MRNWGSKRVLMVTLKIPWLHWTGLNCPKLLVVFCYTTSIALLNPTTMVFMGMNGLIIVDDCFPRKGDMIWKKSNQLFNKFRFKLDTQTNFKILDYLDVTPKLYNGAVSPFRKTTTTNTHVILM